MFDRASEQGQTALTRFPFSLGGFSFMSASENDEKFNLILPEIKIDTCCELNHVYVS